MKIRTLTIVEAWELYRLIKNHFPEKLEDEVIVIDFISDFLEKISPTSLLKILRLLLDEEEVKIEEMTAEETFILLVEGFQINKVFDLYLFFSEILKT